MDGRETGQATVESDQHVQGLGLTDLAHDDAGGPHAQCFLHQPPHGDLASALEVRLACLHRDHVAQPQIQFEDLLDGDHPFSWPHR